MGLVQVKAIEQVSLVRVIDLFGGGVGFQASAKIVKALKSLIDHDFLPEEIKGEQIHRHVGLLDDPVVHVPVWIDAQHGVGKLAHLGRHVLHGDTTFLLVFVLVRHGDSSGLTAYETSPPPSVQGVVFLENNAALASAEMLRLLPVQFFVERGSRSCRSAMCERA